MQASSITGDTPNWILFNDLKKNATKIFNRNKRAHEIKDIENINQKIDRNFQSALNYEISHLSTNRFNGNKYQEGNKIECELDHLLLNKSVGNIKEKFIFFFVNITLAKTIPITTRDTEIASIIFFIETEPLQ